MPEYSPPEYRRDPLSGETVIIAAARSARPNAWGNQTTDDATNPTAATPSQPATTPTSPSDCPFCVGNESRTPGDVQRYPDDATLDDWQVRVIPNLYPAVVDPQTSHHVPAECCSKKDIVDQAPAFGQHEVVIESPDHRCRLTELTDDQLHWTIQAYGDRMKAHRDAGARYSQVFKNHRPSAGASLEHAHSQIISLHHVPPRIQAELLQFAAFAQEHDNCLLCHLIRNESDHPTRVVLSNEDFLVICPYASRLPYELAILPRNHSPHFWMQTAAQQAAFARTLYQTVALLEKLEKLPAFNYLIHSAPFDTDRDDHYHWHLELIPRLARQAGFEWSTGLHLNPIAPETAAARLRDLDPRPYATSPDWPIH